MQMLQRLVKSYILNTIDSCKVRVLLCGLLMFLSCINMDLFFAFGSQEFTRHLPGTVTGQDCGNEDMLGETKLGLISEWVCPLALSAVCVEG